MSRFKMSTSWQELEHLLETEPDATYKRKESRRGPTRSLQDRFVYPLAVCDQLHVALRAHHHTSLDASKAVLHTLRYLFFTMRCGVYVRIHKGRVRDFVPFVNLEYENNWSHLLPDNMLEVYMRAKTILHGAEAVIPVHKWWANAGIFCNVLSSSEPWGQSFLGTYREMLDVVCATYQVPDVQFFLNKRDHPQLKRDLTEPYDFIWDDLNIPLTRERFDSYAPIVGPYTSPAFSDVPWPVAEDWEAATRRLLTRVCKWEDKAAVAVWRGGATGAGVSTETNARLHLAELGWHFPAYVDAKLTHWNVRDKKLFGHPINFIDPSEFPFSAGRHNYLSMEQQAKFKYVIYVAGHSAASRYSTLMRLGSVIFKVEDDPVITTAPNLWFFCMLRPWHDHVPVRHDLSDLLEKVDWCRNNDKECQRIVATAQLFCETFLCKEALVDYMQLALQNMASCYAPSTTRV